MTSTVHAGCILLDASGLLILGPSGSGKSLLGRALIARWQARGRFARLVADDRVGLVAVNDRLVARPQASVQGLAEVRGIGLVKMSHEPVCVLRAAIDLVSEPDERLPESSSLFRAINGVKLPFAKILTDTWLVDRVETFWFQTYL